MRFLITIVLLITGLTTLTSQVATDILRYGSYTPLGTARMMGVGSSFGAMGADYSVTSINPAGIGVFKKSEFTLTPGVGIFGTSSRYQDNWSSDDYTSFGADNIGYVAVNRSFGIESNWKSKNFAIGLSRLKTFKNNASLSGSGMGSIAERWVNMANSEDVSQFDVAFEENLAFDAGAIYKDKDGTFVSDYLSEDLVNKTISYDQKGYLNELAIAWAGNYDNIVHIGAAVGFPFLSYTNNQRYRDNLNVANESGQVQFNNELAFDKNLEVYGSGINFKIGAITDINRLRFGLALHSPTWLSITEEFKNTLAYNYTYYKDDGTVDLTGNESAESPAGEFEYSVRSPWRATGSVGYILKLGKLNGFVNADVDYVDYSSGSFDLTANSTNVDDVRYEAALNSEVDGFAPVLNYRLGAELAYSKVRLRLGYGIEKSGNGVAAEDITNLSAGIGFRHNQYFVDFGVRYSESESDYLPYDTFDTARNFSADVDHTALRMALTFGFKI